MDGLTLARSVAEIQCLAGGKVEKIQQPEKDELLFVVHSCGKNERLLISASPENCRIQLTEARPASPVDAPIFLMLLRKYLLNARINSICQPNSDRVVVVEFEALNELRDCTRFFLHCEIMGKHSNIILVDGNGRIVDAVRRVSPSMSSVRLILPKLEYSAPPAQDKLDPANAAAEDFLNVLSDAPRPDKALSAAFFGLSPSIAALLFDRCTAEAKSRPVHSDALETVSDCLACFYRDLLNARTVPCIALLPSGGRILLPFRPFGLECREFSTLGAAADEFYRSRAENESIKRRTAAVERVISNAVQRLERKIEKFNLAICDEAELEKLRHFGELLTANLHALPPRAENAKVLDYYRDPPEYIVIPLDNSVSPADNAQKYYKQYRKGKVARETAVVQRETAVAELSYLRGLHCDLSNCASESDLNEIRQELVEQGLIRDSSRRKAERGKPSKNGKGAKGSKLPPSRPHKYLSSDGIEIFVGKNNTQNDRLTFKQSAPEDTWLHTKDIHGSHVIIRFAGEIPPKTLEEAAALAAYHSQARGSSAVPVDYTKRRYVKKPSGAKPGSVIYTNQRTLIITPDEDMINSLKKLN